MLLVAVMAGRCGGDMMSAQFVGRVLIVLSGVCMCLGVCEACLPLRMLLPDSVNRIPLVSGVVVRERARRPDGVSLKPTGLNVTLFGRGVLNCDGTYVGVLVVGGRSEYPTLVEAVVKVGCGVTRLSVVLGVMWLCRRRSWLDPVWFGFRVGVVWTLRDGETGGGCVCLKGNAFPLFVVPLFLSVWAHGVAPPLPPLPALLFNCSKPCRACAYNCPYIVANPSVVFHYSVYVEEACVHVGCAY